MKCIATSSSYSQIMIKTIQIFIQRKNLIDIFFSSTKSKDNRLTSNYTDIHLSLTKRQTKYIIKHLQEQLNKGGKA